MTIAQWLALVRVHFPALTASNCCITSPVDEDYNCIAWAAGISDQWWWPDAQGQKFWPLGVTRATTISSFVEAYGTLGFLICGDAEPQEGVEKIALFVDGQGAPTHAARQLADGKWTSKLGPNVDIAHELRALEGPAYGAVSCILARSTAPHQQTSPLSMEVTAEPHS
jgi:hypothetical protein